MRLGVVWYRVPDEVHNADGKHVSYLSPSSNVGRSLRNLDPDLYERLGGVVRSGVRTVDALEQAGVLPAGTRYANAPLSFTDLAPSARNARIDRRRRWLSDALDEVADCDLIFVDPDNGVRRCDHSTPSHRTDAVKHAYYDELAQFIARGQSLIAYHHADRSASVPVQAHRRLADAAGQLAIEPLAAVQASRGSSRLFLIVPVASHISHAGR